MKKRIAYWVHAIVISHEIVESSLGARREGGKKFYVFINMMNYYHAKHE
jgi:hypothetical protein